MLGETDLYRCYTASGVLMYVGISVSALARWCNHGSAVWAEFVAKIEIEKFSSREAAKAAEKTAIISERPIWNNVYGARGRRPSNVSKEEWREDWHKRLAAIGGGVTRQTLNGRYGNPTNPKPAPDTEG